MLVGSHMCKRFLAGGGGKARFNVATLTYEARTRPLHVQHTYYRIIFKQNPFNIISRGVQGCTSTDFRLNNFSHKIAVIFEFFYLYL